MAVDARGARESLQTICGPVGKPLSGHRAGAALDGRPGRLRCGGANRLEPGGLCRSGPPAQRGAGALVRVEVCGAAQPALRPGAQDCGTGACLCAGTGSDRRLAETRRYMEEHLDESLTIPVLSRRACLSATAFKAGFRRLYGLPVHTWLRQRRMERAAELLHLPGLSLEGIAQAVGYSQRQPIRRRFSPAICADARPVPQKCLNRQNRTVPAMRPGRMSVIILQCAKRRACFRTGGDLNETTSLLGLGRRGLHDHGDDHRLQTQMSMR